MLAMKPVVTIQCLPIRNRGYFEWLMTGLQQLEQEGVLELRHEGVSWDCFLRTHPRLYGKLEQWFPDFCKWAFPVDHFSLFAKVECGGKSMRFAYDVTDSPFQYALAHLELADLYFKTQCPITFDAQGYALSKRVRIPYHPEVIRCQRKILPAMSTGPITSTFNLKRNLRLIDDRLSLRVPAKRLRVFASFGGDRGPSPWGKNDLPPAPHNFHNERSLVSFWGDQIQHPNEKRAEVVRRLRAWGLADVDARIWSSKDPAIQGNALGWDEYLKTVAESVFNVNVSGFRRSLPFRFLDSFQMGCAVLTDTLGTRWYADFEKGLEVFEYGDAGYERGPDVNWEGIDRSLRGYRDAADCSLDRAQAIRDRFRNTWHPTTLARHCLNACLDRL
jgi:hypothetical protein